MSPAQAHGDLEEGRQQPRRQACVGQGQMGVHRGSQTTKTASTVCHAILISPIHQKSVLRGLQLC